MTSKTESPGAVATDERALFEKWASDEWNEYGLRRDFDEYAEEPVRDQWRAWQAARALTSLALSDERIAQLQSKSFNSIFGKVIGLDHDRQMMLTFARAIEADLRAALVAAAQAPTDSEIISLHRQLAHETLRADQGWQRYESANADRNLLRAAPALDCAKLTRKLVAARTLSDQHYDTILELRAALDAQPAPGKFDSEAMRNLLADHDRSNPKPHHCHKCGLPMVENPHPDAGKPAAYLQIGVQWECLPCSVSIRHGWYKEAMKLRTELTDIRAALAAQQSPDVARDTARYQFMRNHQIVKEPYNMILHVAVRRPAPNGWCVDSVRGIEMDVAIDKAIAQEKAQ